MLLKKASGKMFGGYTHYGAVRGVGSDGTRKTLSCRKAAYGGGGVHGDCLGTGHQYEQRHNQNYQGRQTDNDSPVEKKMKQRSKHTLMRNTIKRDC